MNTISDWDDKILGMFCITAIVLIEAVARGFGIADGGVSRDALLVIGGVITGKALQKPAA